MSASDVLQLGFLNDFFLVSITYTAKERDESAILDFGRADIQNLEEIKVLSWFWRKTG